eukprot:gene25933-biopygen17878
MSRGGCSRSES